MAWNEPGGGKDQDPWGNRKKQDGPPDLDEIVRNIQDKFGGMFGGRKGGGSGGGSAAFGFGFILILLLIFAFFWGFYKIEASEKGVVLRFGAHLKTTGPGLHWAIPWVDEVKRVDVGQLREGVHKSQMLTKDENLIQIELAVQYKVDNAEHYFFQVREPIKTLNEASESALREVVGSKRLDEIISKEGGRESLVKETREIMQGILNNYNTGLEVVKANLKSAQPPEEVQAAFEDAIKAREDEDRYKKQAEAYKRDILPKAEGDAQRLIEEAEADKQRVIEKARGEASRFSQVYAEYLKAPEVTRTRLYIQMMERAMSNVGKVIVNMDKGNNVLYLPLGLDGKGFNPSQLVPPSSVNQAPSSSGIEPEPQIRRPAPRQDSRRSREGR